MDDVTYDLPPAVYEVSRMDEHGTSFLVATVFSKEAADRRLKELESSAHKQTYFIAKRLPGENKRMDTPMPEPAVRRKCHANSNN